MRLSDREAKRQGDPKEVSTRVHEDADRRLSHSGSGQVVGSAAGRGSTIRTASLADSKPCGLSQEYLPIASLTLYNKSWAIKARVTNRSGIKAFAQRQSGTESRLASVDLLDESGGEIRATMFGADVDRFYPLMTDARVVIVRRGTLKNANKRYSSLAHNYEITLNSWSEVTPCDGADDDGKIKQQRYNFMTIADCERLDGKEHADQTFDVIGCIRQVGPASSFAAKTSGKVMTKRLIVITDRSGRSTDLALWGDLAIKYGGNIKDDASAEVQLDPGTVVAIKTCKIADYAPPKSTERPSRSLNTTFGSVVVVNPAVDEARELEKWWNGGGRLSDIDNMTRRFGGASGGPPKPISSIVADRLGLGDSKGDYITVRGTITFFFHDPTKPPWYDACPHLHPDQKDQRGQPRYCMKKAIKNELDGGYADCHGCRQRVKQPIARYILHMLVTDATASTWVTCFDEQAVALLGGTKADVLKHLIDVGNISAYDAIFTRHNFMPYIFRLHAKLDDYHLRDGGGGEPRVRCRVMSATPLKYEAECTNLIGEINLLDLR